MTKIAIINCGSKKKDYACATREMYEGGSLFKKMREYAEKANAILPKILRQGSILSTINNIKKPKRYTKSILAGTGSHNDIEARTYCNKLLG